MTESREHGKGTLKSREWKTREWKSRHQNARLDVHPFIFDAIAFSVAPIETRTRAGPQLQFDRVTGDCRDPMYHVGLREERCPQAQVCVQMQKLFICLYA